MPATAPPQLTRGRRGPLLLALAPVALAAVLTLVALLSPTRISQAGPVQQQAMEQLTANASRFTLLGTAAILTVVSLVAALSVASWSRGSQVSAGIRRGITAAAVAAVVVDLWCWLTVINAGASVGLHGLDQALLARGIGAVNLALAAAITTLAARTRNLTAVLLAGAAAVAAAPFALMAIAVLVPL